MKESLYIVKIAIRKQDINLEIWDLFLLFNHWEVEDNDPNIMAFWKESTNKTELGTELRKISMELGGKVIREEMTKVSNVYSSIED